MENREATNNMKGNYPPVNTLAYQAESFGQIILSCRQNHKYIIVQDNTVFF